MGISYLNLAVMASGRLGFHCLKNILKTRSVDCVLTDSQSIEIILFCKNHRIPCFVGNPRGGRGFSFCKDRSIDVLFSINYLFLIESDLISLPKIISLNIHGSLLPRYRGRTPHVWSIINGETEGGVTVHKLTPGCDEGPVLLQKVVPILHEDTGASLLAKFKVLYPSMIENSLRKVEAGDLLLVDQDESKASSFPKRTPDDGEIDWNWSGIRVFNWIRALAPPYPGAFFVINNKKYVVASGEILNSPHDIEKMPGTVSSVIGNELVIKSRDSSLRVFLTESPDSSISPGIVISPGR